MPSTSRASSRPSRRILAGTVGRRIVWRTITGCMTYRVGGLAAEIAFFGMLAIPPLIFGLAGVVGFIARAYPVTTIETFQNEVLAFSGKFLTDDAVQQLIAPTLAEVLGGRRFDVISIGFVIALWSGSRAMSVLVDTVTIMYGMSGERSWIRQRLFAFGVYVIALLGGAVLLPLMLAGPRIVDAIAPDALTWLGDLYWPIVVVVTTAAVATLYHVAVPLRDRWFGAIPGAMFTMVVWIAGSEILRRALGFAIGSSSVFGPLSTPIALLLWLYLIAMAILIGAALNAAVASVSPELAGLTQREADRVLTSASGKTEKRRTSVSLEDDSAPPSPVEDPTRPHDLTIEHDETPTQHG